MIHGPARVLLSTSMKPCVRHRFNININSGACSSFYLNVVILNGMVIILVIEMYDLWITINFAC